MFRSVKGPLWAQAYQKNMKAYVDFGPDIFSGCRCQNWRILGRGSRTVRLRQMVTGGRGHDVYPGSGPLDGGNTLRPA